MLRSLFESLCSSLRYRENADQAPMVPPSMVPSGAADSWSASASSPEASLSDFSGSSPAHQAFNATAPVDFDLGAALGYK